MAPLVRCLPLSLWTAWVVFSDAMRQQTSSQSLRELISHTATATHAVLSELSESHLGDAKKDDADHVDLTDKFNGKKTIQIGDVTYRCCCMVGGLDGGVTCLVQDAAKRGPHGNNKYWGGCGRLLGEGWHSYLPKPEFGNRRHAGKCWVPKDTLPTAFKEPDFAKTFQHGDDRFEAQCESDDDRGWPRFQSKDALQASPWAPYFQVVYGGLPEVYPVCIYDMWNLNKEAYEQANISGRTVVTPTPGCVDCLKEGDLFETPQGYGIYHGSWKPLPPNTWFEVAHVALPTELEGFWVWRTRGSGVWYNTGNTMVFPQPSNPMKTHADAIKFLKQNCSVKVSPYWPRQESDIFGACAREKGIDTIQFEPTAGQVPLGSFGQAGFTETLIVNMDGKFNCGVEDASKTPLREGWLAKQQCDCINYDIPESCGLMPRPPPGMSLLEDPPLCKLREKKVPFWKSKPKCDPSSCKATRCRAHQNLQLLSS